MIDVMPLLLGRAELGCTDLLTFNVIVMPGGGGGGDSRHEMLPIQVQEEIGGSAK